MKIEARKSSKQGLGVFAVEDIKKDEIIEKCPYFLFADDDVTEGNRIFDYCYSSPWYDGEYMLMMGLGSLYNHDEDPNVGWYVDDDVDFAKFYALRDIKAGEELCHNYGEDYWTSREIDPA